MSYKRSIFIFFILAALIIFPVQQALAIPHNPAVVQSVNLQTFQSLAGQDGFIVESSETSGVGGIVNTTGLAIQVGDNAKDRQMRGMVAFNTASLPNNAIIISATLKLKKQGLAGTNPFTTHGKLLVEIRQPFFGNATALEALDFQASTLAAAGTVQATPVNGYYTASLTKTALGHINTAGFTQLRLRFQLDDNDDMSPDFLSFHSGNAATAGFRPILEVKYSIPTTATPTQTATKTLTTTPVNTFTPTLTRTPTITLTITETSTVTETPTVTPTAYTETPTPTLTPTITNTPTITPTPTFPCYDC